MKYQIMTGILFTLLARRKVSASDLAGKYGCSTRSIYRYVDELSISGIPVDVQRGANGGIFISDAFTLPKGLLSKDEYRRTMDAMLTMNEQMNDPVLQSAIDKMTAQIKTNKLDLTISGNILVDSGTWGDSERFSEKLSLVERAIENKIVLEIDYVSREGEQTQRRIYPHLLVYKQNIWYVYAFCEMRNAFRLFKLGRIRTVLKTEDTFEKIPFNREDVPLKFWHDAEKSVFALFEISPEALPFAEEWLGVENVVKRDDIYTVEALLPDDESLLGKILSLGAGFRVLSPQSLVQRVAEEVERIANAYRK